jgi:Uma2 family endonuclease
MIRSMSSVADAPATTTYFRPVIFRDSGRDDYVASACMTFEEWLKLDYEGGLSEWVDGEARLYMSATAEHQVIIGFLQTLLNVYAAVRGVGRVMAAPYAMEAVTGGRGREPDLMFVAMANLHRLQSSHLHGPPDLVIEVVSDDSVTRDREDKFTEYASAGAGEYWVIDSRPGHQQADFFVLESGALRRVEPGEDGIYHSTVVEGFWLRVAWLWESPKPVAAALQELLGASFA